MGNTCPVCSRTVKSENPQKGEVSWETTYCSHYCRLFDERKLTKVPFKGGNKHHNNKLAWPIIKVKCDMCEKEATLKHELERGNVRTVFMKAIEAAVNKSEEISEGEMRFVIALSICAHREQSSLRQDLVPRFPIGSWGSSRALSRSTLEGLDRGVSMN